MNILISTIYAPLVFLSLRYFDIKIISLAVFFLSLIWFVITLKKDRKNTLYPLLYIILSIVTFFLEEFLVLKAIPLIISVVITSIIFISYINKKSIILYFATKFSKEEIDDKEKEYIQRSTLFWIGVSCVNILSHIFVFLNENIEFWVYYSSFGWYFMFGAAGVLQFLHRKFYFLKVSNV
jgi:uncharacterized membrane protein